MWTDAAAAADRRAGRSAPIERPSEAAARRHRRGGRPAAVALTLTVGFGPSLFERDGEDRFGLAAPGPARCASCPRCPATCSTRPAPAATCACRRAPTTRRSPSTPCATWLRLGRGTVELRWLQLGFAGNTTHDARQATPRNLMGFKDGTRNLRAEDTDAMDRFVWVGGERAAGLDARRHLPRRPPHPDADRVLGPRRARRPGDASAATRPGAPLGGSDEFDTPDFGAKRQDGSPVIPADAHIRLAAPEMQRRRADPAPRLRLHRRHRPRTGAARRRPLLHLLPARSRRPSSSRSSAGSAHPMRSANTSSTPQAPCSRFLPEHVPEDSWARVCSPSRSRASRGRPSPRVPSPGSRSPRGPGPAPAGSDWRLRRSARGRGASVGPP